MNYLKELLVKKLFLGWLKAKLEAFDKDALGVILVVINRLAWLYPEAKFAGYLVDIVAFLVSLKPEPVTDPGIVRLIEENVDRMAHAFDSHKLAKADNGLPPAKGHA